MGLFKISQLEEKHQMDAEGGGGERRPPFSYLILGVGEGTVSSELSRHRALETFRCLVLMRPALCLSLGPLRCLPLPQCLQST